MCEGAGSIDVSPFPSPFIAFKPRQVILSEQLRRSKAGPLTMEKNRLEKSAHLKPEDESILSYSVALWLETKGFSKVLKRFLSAAGIQDDDWKAKALKLNEIFSKYIEICNGVKNDSKPQTKTEELADGLSENNGVANVPASEEIGDKKKKKKKKRNTEENAVTDNERVSEEKVKSNAISKEEKQKSKSLKNNDEKACELAVDQSSKAQKNKEKKRTKSTSESVDLGDKLVGVVPEVVADEDLTPEIKISKNEPEVVDETKDKKKRKKKKDNISQNDTDGDMGNNRTAVSDKDTKDLNSENDEVLVEDELQKKDDDNKSKKASKKRKRMGDQDSEKPRHEEAGEESKPKKSKGLDQNKEVKQQITVPEANGHTHPIKNEENLSGNKSAKDDLHNNGLIETSHANSAGKKHGSSQPKTVNAFQRVKIDEVEFIDDRLQDNSYWAKDGAEIGYGAKAQEVLGQVKGRDFRHEKTKKKRGSYRGGQIDLQSHSVKFNYSDDE